MQAQQVLHKLLNNVGSMMHQTRRVALEVNVMAALSGTRLTVTDLGRSIQSPVKQQQHYHYQANSVRHRSVLSVFTIGWQCLKRKQQFYITDFFIKEKQEKQGTDHGIRLIHD